MADNLFLNDSVLLIDNLCKSYVKGKLVNDHISLSLGRGEIFGLLGPNGAGKTTLVSQIIGLAKPDSGRITIDDVDIIAKPGYARQACSFQAQTQVPINGLTAIQAIELVGRVRGGDVKTVQASARELLHNLEMEEWTKKSAETFSGGMRRLVAFCMAAVVPGKIVILDEPTNDIDPLRRRLLWQEVRNLVAMGSSVLLVTHNVLEAERAEVPDFPEFILNTTVTGRRLIGRMGESDIPAAVQWARNLKDHGIAEEYSVGPASLEDVYLKVVGRGEAQEITEKEAGHDAVTA